MTKNKKEEFNLITISGDEVKIIVDLSYLNLSFPKKPHVCLFWVGGGA